MTGAAGDLQATTFASQLRMLDAPREDTPARIVALPVPPGTRDFLPPLEGSREALVLYVRQLEDRGDPAAQARLERLRAWAREAG
jgi:hypothetical protein